MKKFLFLLPVLFLAAACGNHKPIDPVYIWPSSGVKEADSLTLAFSRTIGYGTVPADSSNNNALFKRFDSVVSQHPDNKLVALRYDYFRICRIEAQGNNRKWQQMFDSIFPTIDTVLFKYDYYKWRQLKAHHEKSRVDAYGMAVQNFEYSRSIDDYFEMSRSAILLGNMLATLGDNKSAHSYYQFAIDNAEKFNFGDILVSASLNDSQFQDSIQAVRTLRRMLDLPIVKLSPERRSFLLFALFERTRDMADVDSAILLQDQVLPSKSLRPLFYMRRGEMLVERSEFDSATKYFKLAMNSLNDSYSRPDSIYTLFRRAEAYDYDRQLDSAYLLMNRAFLALERLSKQSGAPRVYGMEMKSRIDLVKRNNEIERTRLWMVACLVTLIIILIAGAFILVYRKRALEKKLRSDLFEQKLRHSQEAMELRRLMTCESDTLISNIEEVIDTERKKGLVDHPVIAELSRLLKSHKGLEADREAAVTVKEGLDPSISEALHRDFPRLTHGQLKMASMIIIGADNRQIARALNISLESVWKGRHRLRGRLGCPPGSDLDNFLRDYASQNLPHLPD